MTPPLAPNSDNYILGRGELLFDRFDANGARTGYFHLGNCANFKISLKDDVLELFSSMDASSGLLKRVTRKRTVEIEITSNEFSAIDNMALALMGDNSSLTQTSAAVTGEVLTTSVAAGRFYRTAGRQISTVVVTQGTVTWSATTDYTVHDAVGGLIQVVQSPSTRVSTGTTATIAYTRASASLTTILGATKSKVEGGLLFMPDPTTGQAFDVEVYRAAVQPTGEVGLISDNWGEYGLNMVALSDAQGSYGGSATSPYFRFIDRGTATQS